jgi:membrane-associated protein
MPILQNLMNWALATLGAHGYLIVLAATTLENIFIAGSFTPGDLITAAAAVVAATHAGADLSPWLLIVVGTIGSVIGANISYFIGYRGGRELIERLGPRFGINTQAIEAAEEYFFNHGAETVFLARYVAVLKNVAPALAGASRMSLWWFEGYSFLGALVYCSGLVGIGWFLGANFRIGLKYFGAMSWLMLFVVFAGGIWLWTRKRSHDQKLIAKNAADFEEDCRVDAAGEDR